MRRPLDECLPILELLTLRTRVAALDHLVRFKELYPLNASQVPSNLYSLEQSGYLISQTLTIRVPVFEKPIFVWEPGGHAPDIHGLANMLNARTYAPRLVATKLYWATRKAESITGGLSGANRQPLQVQHDLGTTAVYLNFLAQNPHEACHWFGEDILLRDFRCLLPRKRPDAAVFGEDDSPTRLIEIGGVYSAEGLRRAHRHYSRQGVIYEIW